MHQDDVRRVGVIVHDHGKAHPLEMTLNAGQITGGNFFQSGIGFGWLRVDFPVQFQAEEFSAIGVTHGSSISQHLRIFQPLDDFLAHPDLLWILNLAFLRQASTRFQVLRFCHLEPLDVIVDIHFLFDERIACCTSLDLRIRERQFIAILRFTGRCLRGHDLRDEPLLVFDQLPHICVKRSFRDIAEDFDPLVLVALADNAATPLF